MTASTRPIHSWGSISLHSSGRWRWPNALKGASWIERKNCSTIATHQDKRQYVSSFSSRQTPAGSQPTVALHIDLSHPAIQSLIRLRKKRLFFISLATELHRCEAYYNLPEESWCVVVPRKRWCNMEDTRGSFLHSPPAMTLHGNTAVKRARIPAGFQPAVAEFIKQRCKTGPRCRLQREKDNNNKRACWSLESRQPPPDTTTNVGSASALSERVMVINHCPDTGHKSRYPGGRILAPSWRILDNDKPGSTPAEQAGYVPLNKEKIIINSCLQSTQIMWVAHSAFLSNGPVCNLQLSARAPAAPNSNFRNWDECYWYWKGAWELRRKFDVSDAGMKNGHKLANVFPSQKDFSQPLNIMISDSFWDSCIGPGGLRRP